MVNCLGKRIYKDIAPYYDNLMHDVNYDAWIAYVRNICELNDCKPEHVLDLGCGTGIPALLLLRSGCAVVGIDGSLEMLRVAQSKLQSYNPPLILSSFEEFYIKKKVDLVISLFDSLNNLIDEGKLRQTFVQVAQCLRDEGLFVFDMNTIYGLCRMDKDAIYTKEIKDIYSIWKSRFNRQRAITTLSITLFVAGNGSYKRIDETHLERGYSLGTIRHVLQQTGFEKIVFYEHLTFRRPGPRTQRVMVVARKR
jgi:ubiquinone/menaquinone biosynthesis C-methylase UbiE